MNNPECPICHKETIPCVTKDLKAFEVCFECNYISEPKAPYISYIRNIYEECFPEEYEDE